MDELRGDNVPPGRAEAPPTPLPAPPSHAPDTAPGRRSGRRWLWRCVLLTGLAVAAWGAWRRLEPQLERHASAAREGRREAPSPVGVATVGTGDMNVVLTGLGTVTPMATITVDTRISGELMAVGYREGQLVTKGSFLAEIDPRPYQVALEQAQATLAHESALLAQAKSDLARYVKLNREDSIAQQQAVDQEFLVQQDQATVQLDQANVDSAKLNLTYCHIVSPVTGRVGLRLVDPGNYVQTASSTALVVVTQLQPITVIFVLPEDDIPEVTRQLQGGQALRVSAYDRTNSVRIAEGTLLTVDNTVDTTTGAVKLRASFPNTDNALFPNQFVNARLVLNTLHDVTHVPEAAVQHGAPGTFVYIVKPDSTVHLQVIRTGVSDDGEVQVLSGLKAGDTVVVDGIDRLTDGAKVRITPGADDQAATNDGPGAPPGEQSPDSPPVPRHSNQHRQTGP
jgi:multidrug efflux system membrane fusion protein